MGKEMGQEMPRLGKDGGSQAEIKKQIWDVAPGEGGHFG